MKTTAASEIQFWVCQLETAALWQAFYKRRSTDIICSCHSDMFPLFLQFNQFVTMSLFLPPVRHIPVHAGDQGHVLESGNKNSSPTLTSWPRWRNRQSEDTGWRKGVEGGKGRFRYCGHTYTYTYTLIAWVCLWGSRDKDYGWCPQPDEMIGSVHSLHLTLCGITTTR